MFYGCVYATPQLNYFCCPTLSLVRTWGVVNDVSFSKKNQKTLLRECNFDERGMQRRAHTLGPTQNQPNTSAHTARSGGSPLLFIFFPLFVCTYQTQEWRRKQKGPTGTWSLGEVLIVVISGHACDQKSTSCMFCLLFFASLSSITYLVWFIDDESARLVSVNQSS